ncbi:MAG: hypothetical protein WCT02_04700 [Candidatus Paceibacterota bacterium]|jgi:hypothetical protein
MKKFLSTVLILIILAAIGAAGYYSYTYLALKNSLTFAPINIPGQSATSTHSLGTATSTDLVATSTVNRASWKVYSNDELGFTLKYPSDLIVNNTDNILILAFPKKTYFHWPLQDDVTLTVSATTSCPTAKALGETFFNQSGTLTVDGQKFNTFESDDAAAGNRYTTITYSISGNDACYLVVFNDHGVNGAGLYVNDQILVKKYDNQHDVDMAKVTDVVYGILGSFQVKILPQGLPEDSYKPGSVL